MANWVFITGALFLAFLFYITWGAWQGYFSPVIPPIVDTPEKKKLQEEKETLQNTVQLAKDSIFGYENSSRELQARANDLERALQQAMNDINDLTTKIAQLQDENATLRKGLKEALEQLDLCRKQLMQCKTMIDAKRLEKQFCERVPSSNLLL